jgi:hypothetical protein
MSDGVQTARDKGIGWCSGVHDSFPPLIILSGELLRSIYERYKHSGSNFATQLKHINNVSRIAIKYINNKAAIGR